MLYPNETYKNFNIAHCNNHISLLKITGDALYHNNS